MARYFKPISIQELSNHMAKAIRKIDGFEDSTDYHGNAWTLDTPDNVERSLEYLFNHTEKGLNTKMISDLNKVYFDLENVMCSFKQNEHLDDMKDIMGFHELDNGFTFCGLYCGGDWEMPVFFIIYHDGSTLRGYIPEDGNSFNKQFMSAFGSEGDSPKGEEAGLDWDYESDDENFEKRADAALIIADIKNRITLKP